MTHEQILDQAVHHAASWADRLRGRSILIAGASGFLAASLLIFLSRLDREFALNLRLYASARRRPEAVPLFRFMKVAAPARWSTASVERTEVPDVPGLIVVHTASFGSPLDYQREPLPTFTANTLGVVQLFEQAIQRKAAQFVYLSSAEIYGQPPDQAIPTAEDYVGGLQTLSSRSIYGESKRMAEVLGTCLSEASKVPFTVVRPWNIYGPGQRAQDGRVPIEFLRQARATGKIELLSNGSPRRTFCHAWPGVLQIAALLGAPAVGGAWNVGSGDHETSVLQLAQTCAKVSGLSPSDVTYDPLAKSPGIQRSAPNVEKIKSHIGSDFEVPLETGLKSLVEWLTFLEADNVPARN